MNKKGQALVEFIIVMPIFVMLLLAAFDFVKIIQTKMTLESAIEEVILDNNYKLEDNVLLNKETENDMITYRLSKDVDITSPLITLVIDNSYKVMVERTVYAE
ncbi:MAG: pilus assembly protein [Bacilli bacterium]|nr:pilus assembly protein [Bacilli bacterium]